MTAIPQKNPSVTPIVPDHSKYQSQISTRAEKRTIRALTVLFRKRCAESVSIKKVQHVLRNARLPPKSLRLYVQSAMGETVNIQEDQMYDQTHPHPAKLQTEAETDVDYGPNFERNARDEMSKYKYGDTAQRRDTERPVEHIDGCPIVRLCQPGERKGTLCSPPPTKRRKQ
jgi:hypothetical protein